MTTEHSKYFALNQAHEAAGELVIALMPACEKIMIAGSIRRRMHHVHDIDLVVWTHYNDQMNSDLFGDQHVELGGPEDLVKAIDKIMQPSNTLICVKPDAKIIKFTYKDIPVEIYLAERDGKNFDALLQMRTGSAAFNVWLAKRAQYRGNYYKAGYGIFESDQPGAVRLDDGTEEGIFRALGLSCQSPENRY